METHSRWYRGTLAFKQSPKGGKIGLKGSPNRRIIKTETKKLRDQEISLELHATKGWRKRRA